MRDKERIERILELLKTYWEEHEDYRFGQMLINLGICRDDLRLWNNEDDGLEKYLKDKIKEVSKNG